MEKKVAQLPAYLMQQRWYRSKTRKISRVEIEAQVSPTGENEKSSLLLSVARVFFEDGGTEQYSLIDDDNPSLSGLALLKLALEGTQTPLGSGVLHGLPFLGEEIAPEEKTFAQLLGGEQSNTSFVFSSGHFLKLYRHLEEGLHPEAEMLSFLKQVNYPHVPAFRASIEWQHSGESPIIVALAQDRVETKSNAWEYMLKRLASLENGSLPEDLVQWIRQLGSRTAGLHLALASRHDSEAFAPEPLPPQDLQTVRSSIAHLLQGMINSSENPVIPESLAALTRMENSLAQTDALGSKIRIHGDFHLGQILCCGNEGTEIKFIDFEGEPSRPLAEKRRKQSPLRDVAGMLRSFHYAAHVAAPSPEKFDPALPETLGALFLEAYYEIISASDLLPTDALMRDALLDFFVLEKAVYELHYELNNRPDWAEIPLRGLRALLREG